MYAEIHDGRIVSMAPHSESYSITSQLDGCFRAMPKLASLSTCSIRISNFSTTLPHYSNSHLSELWFQRYLHCQGIDPCTTMTTRTLSDASDLREHNADQVLM
jgi:hypothetical protein